LKNLGIGTKVIRMNTSIHHGLKTFK